ncbi:MAG: lamin tail domain-containing protein [Fidelibacterota bacterium]
MIFAIPLLAALILFSPDRSVSAGIPYEATIMTYNLWNYIGTSSTDNAREDDLEAVILSVAPDILVVQEINGTTGYTHFLEDVLTRGDPGRYEGAPFSNQPETEADIALFYLPDVFGFVSTRVVDLTSEYGHRDAVEFVLQHLSTGTRLRVYGVHLKAGTEPENQSDRESEAGKLRNYLNDLEPDTFFLVAGDFNVYDSNEGAFRRLTGSQVDNDGRLFDPLNRPGEWHNNSGFADIHTQSSRGSYGGEWYGGLDDRFDFILISAAVRDTNGVNVAPGSYTSFGNDGNHFNRAVNDGTNSAVSSEIADALVEASDHLPVTMKLTIHGAEPSPYRVVINEIMQNPRRVSDGLGEWFELYNADSVTLYLCGWTVEDWSGEKFPVECGPDSLRMAPGEYVVLGPNGDMTTNGGVPVDYPYPYGSFRLTNDADQILLFDSSGREVDRVEYDGGGEFPSPEGASMALVDVTLDNNVGENWTVSTRPYGDGDLGTPGESNFGPAVEDGPALPYALDLRSWPNPFNASTTILFTLPEAARVRLAVVDLAGRGVAVLADGWMEGGRHEIVWTADHLSSGIYVCRLEAGGFSRTRKLLLIK